MSDRQDQLDRQFSAAMHTLGLKKDPRRRKQEELKKYRAKRKKKKKRAKAQRRVNRRR